MADNYLENKMEEHRSRMNGSTPRHAVSSRLSSASKPRPGRLVTDYPEMVVAVVDGGDELLVTELVRALRSVDFKVDIVSENKGLSLLAQRTGARFVPCASRSTVQALEAGAASRGVSCDAVIHLGSDRIMIVRGDDCDHVNATVPVSTAVSAVMWILSPGAAPLKGTVVI